MATDLYEEFKEWIQAIIAVVMLPLCWLMIGLLWLFDKKNR